jgi:hypothetical protein
MKVSKGMKQLAHMRAIPVSRSFTEHSTIKGKSYTKAVK